MAKLKCKCGNVLSNSAAFKTNGYFVSDDFLINECKTDEEIIEECDDVWLCPKCDRIAWQDVHTNKITWYGKEA